MLVSVQELLDRAKAIVDADEVAVRGWIPDSTWLMWLNRETRRGYRALIRAGVLAPERQQILFEVGFDEVEIGTPLAVVGVYLVTDQGPVWLPQRHTVDSIVPTSFLKFEFGVPTHWELVNSYTTGPTALLHPAPTSGDYRVVIIPSPPALVTASPGDHETTLIYMPDGLDERIVLGAALSAATRDGTVPPSIRDAIRLWDGELDLAAQQALVNEAPRIRNVDFRFRGTERRGQDTHGAAPVDPSSWRWIV